VRRIFLAKTHFTGYFIPVIAPKFPLKPGVLAGLFLILMLASCRSGSDHALQPPPPVPLLAVSPDTLDYDSTGVTRVLTLKNIGGAALEWALISWPAWVNPSVSSGDLNALDSTVITVELDRSQLAVGEHQGALVMTSGDSMRTITILATVSPFPVLGQMPDTLNFGAFLDSLELIIRNTGSDTLYWNASFSEAMFHAAQLTGGTASADSIWIYFDRDALPAGSYQATMQINTNGGDAQLLLRGYAGATTGQWLTHLGSAPETAYAPFPTDYYFLVRFEKPTDFSSYKISRVRVKLYSLYGAFDVIQLLCYSLVAQNGYWFPDVQYGLLHYSPELNPDLGWNEWAVDWYLTQEAFAVGYFQKDFTEPIFPQPYYSIPGAAGYSYRVYQQPQGYFIIDLLADWEWCVEVYVEPVYALSSTRRSSGFWLKPSAVSPFLSVDHRVTPSSREGVRVSVSTAQP
jgi:hypothetical protein